MPRPCLLSVVIVNWNTRELLRECLASLQPHLGGISNEVIVVDNGSSDGSPEMVARAFPEVRLIRNRDNLGFGRANNIGMAVATGEFFLLLNSDARLTDAAVVRLIARMKERPDVAVAGPRIVHEDGRLQPSARRFPSVGRLLLSELWLHRLLGRSRAADRLLGHYWDHAEEREVDWLVGACLVVRHQVFQETGGFDPSMFMYGEEVDWCRRIRDRGWRVLFSPTGDVLHLDHRSADLLLGAQGRLGQCLDAEDALLRRWEGWRGGLAPLVRLSGAVLRLALFGTRHAVRPSDAYARDVVRAARATITHYLRRPAPPSHGPAAPMTGAGRLERFRDVYDEPAVVADTESRHGLDGAERLLCDAYLKPGMAILDVGVGTGRTSPDLSRLAGRYVGIDSSPAMLARCRRLHPALPLVRLDASDMSAFASGSFDAVVFSFNGIDYLPTVQRRRSCLRECARLLRAGGVLIFSSHNARYLLLAPVLDSSKPWRNVWRIVLAAAHSIRLSGRLARRSFRTGDGYVVDHLAYGLRTYTATPTSVAEEVREFGFRVLRVVNARYPRSLPGWATPWYYYACRRDG